MTCSDCRHYYSSPHTAKDRPCDGWCCRYPAWQHKNASTRTCGEFKKPPRKTTAEKFTKPSLAELQKYVSRNKYELDCQNFLDFYESKGWKVGKNPMKDWQAAVRTWQKNKPDGKQPLKPLIGKTCGKQNCGLPAVYKSTGGAFTHYYCTEHLPPKVKERYQ